MSKKKKIINNSIYEALGEKWYSADGNPIALLRAEAKLKNPWVAAQIAARLGPGPRRVLDIGCGAGFLANFLGAAGHSVHGLDASPSSLRVAAEHDATGRVQYVTGDAYALPFDASRFDVVCAMDFLEHVDDPARVVAEAARVLVPGGLFFFHTFNRGWLAHLVVIRMIDWFIRDAEKDFHVIHLFVTPRELQAYCARAGLAVEHWSGIRPRLFSIAALKTLLTGNVDPRFSFTLSSSLRIGYLGIARKTSA